MRRRPSVSVCAVHQGDVGVGAGGADSRNLCRLEQVAGSNGAAGAVSTDHHGHALRDQGLGSGRSLGRVGSVVRVDQLHVVGGATDVHRGGLLIGILHTQHLLLAAGTGVAGGGLEHTDADHIPPAAAGVAGGCVAAAAAGGQTQSHDHSQSQCKNRNELTYEEQLQYQIELLKRELVKKEAEVLRLKKRNERKGGDARKR